MDGAVETEAVVRAADAPARALSRERDHAAERAAALGAAALRNPYQPHCWPLLASASHCMSGWTWEYVQDAACVVSGLTHQVTADDTPGSKAKSPAAGEAHAWPLIPRPAAT